MPLPAKGHTPHEPCARCGTLAEDPQVSCDVSHHRHGVLCVGCTEKLGGGAKAVRWLARFLQEEETA